MVGVVTVKEGIEKVTRRTGPAIVVTAVATTEATGVPEFRIVTVTFEGGIIAPVGKPVPVTLMTEPAWPDVGEVGEVSVMLAAHAGQAAARITATRKSNTGARLEKVCADASIHAE